MIDNSDIDNMLEAMGGREFLQNKTVLDCTLGLFSKSIVTLRIVVITVKFKAPFKCCDVQNLI